MNLLKLKALSVSKVNSYIKRIILNDPILYNINIEGEISNFKIHSSNNIYFSLKDEKSKINCIMFKDKAKLNQDVIKDIKDGDKVLISGNISIYEKEGTYQVYTDKITKIGMGDLYKEYLRIKNSLELKGYFDKSTKKKINRRPKKIGIITSDTGAAIRDIINVISRRYKFAQLILYPSLVQGDRAEINLIDGIEYFNNKNKVDTIILGRGGGSIEELWAFNSEELAYKIYESKIPIISAVGHETDFTIADFVADLRAATPSVAGELCVEDFLDIEYDILDMKNRLNSSINNKVDKASSSMEKFKAKLFTKDVLNLNYKALEIDALYDKLNASMDKNLKKKENDLAKLSIVLNNTNPFSLMNKGYSIIKKDGKIISDIKNIKKDDKIDLILKNGSAKLKVVDINK